MVGFSVEEYTDTKVYTITVGNRELFWIKMCNAQVGLDVQNMSELVRKEIHGIFETKNLKKRLNQKALKKRKRIG